MDPLPVLEEPPEGRREEAQRKAPAETVRGFMDST